MKVSQKCVSNSSKHPLDVADCLCHCLKLVNFLLIDSLLSAKWLGIGHTTSTIIHHIVKEVHLFCQVCLVLLNLLLTGGDRVARRLECLLVAHLHSTKAHVGNRWHLQGRTLGVASLLLSGLRM